MSTLVHPRIAMSEDVRHLSERRVSDRWALDGLAVAHETGGASFGRRHALRLTDGSSGGLGATSHSALAPGTTIVVTFSRPGGGTARGTVIRCLPDGHGYRVAVRLDGRAAA